MRPSRQAGYSCSVPFETRCACGVFAIQEFVYTRSSAFEPATHHSRLLWNQLTGTNQLGARWNEISHQIRWQTPTHLPTLQTAAPAPVKRAPPAVPTPAHPGIYRQTPPHVEPAPAAAPPRARMPAHSASRLVRGGLEMAGVAPTRLALVGCGDIFSHHHNAVRESGGLFSVACVCDPDAAKASAVQGGFPL